MMKIPDRTAKPLSLSVWKRASRRRRPPVTLLQAHPAPIRGRKSILSRARRVGLFAALLFGILVHPVRAESGNEARKQFQRSKEKAEEGDASAQRTLGFCYMRGEGVKKDAVEAVKWLRMAADQGDAAAQSGLGRCYEKGEGVEKDAAEAAKWYRKAEGRLAFERELNPTPSKPAVPAPTAPNAVQKWQAKAIEKYPDLSVAGSPLNRAFLAEVERRRVDAPAFFEQSDWPMRLADDVAANRMGPASAPPAQTPDEPGKHGPISTGNGSEVASDLAFIQQARREGRSDAEISASLSKTSPIFAAAITAGFSFSEIEQDFLKIAKGETTPAPANPGNK